tara:strand:- start:381 stop:752 length:372 start_codon:yes stop_codon:yes gene_type:complete
VPAYLKRYYIRCIRVKRKTFFVKALDIDRIGHYTWFVTKERKVQNTYKITKRFYEDHVERDLIAPDVVKKTKTHFWIDATENEAMAELRSDALFYGLGNIDDYEGLRKSAIALLNVIGFEAAA